MRYAAYGSNLHPLRLGARVSSSRLIGTSFLSDWSLRFHKSSNDQSGKCNILVGGDGIYIAIYEMNHADKIILDKIEGLGYGYSNCSLMVPEFGKCATYIADASHIDDVLRPYDWYKELVLAGTRKLGFPDDYIRTIEAIDARQDPDVARREDRWQTVEMIRTGT